MTQLNTCEQGVSSFARRIVNLERKGDKVLGHKHVEDHVTRVSSGSVYLRAFDGERVVLEGYYAAPSDILVKRDLRHELEALEDNTVVHCIFEEGANTAPIL